MPYFKVWVHVECYPDDPDEGEEEYVETDLPDCVATFDDPEECRQFLKDLGASIYIPDSYDELYVDSI
jgi:hypothetical protein